jgi:hypothetical protein
MGGRVKKTGEPHEVSTFWEAPDGSAWRLVFWLKRIAGRIECVGLELHASHPERPLRAKTLRALKFSSELERTTEGEHASLGRLADLGRRLGAVGPLLTDELAMTAGGKPRQRARYTSKDLQRVAAVYSERWIDSKSPTRDTAEILGLRYDQTAKLLHRCRLLGLLPKTDPGVARGSEEDDG